MIISVKHNIFLIIPRYSTERQEQSRIWRISPQDQGQPSLLQLFVHVMMKGEKNMLDNSKLRSPVRVDDDWKLNRLISSGPPFVPPRG